MAEVAAEFRDWIGRRQVASDLLTPSPVERLAVTLDREDPPPRPGDAVPPGWHWLYFLETVPLHQVGADGHPAKGDFLPPLPLPRRMFAGGRHRFLRPLRIGERVERHSEVSDIAIKQGRSGPLGFVTVRHTMSDGGGPCVVEEQSLVYREAARPGEIAAPPEPPPPDAAFSRRIAPDIVLLFRFSALLFNGHRIHYDRGYARREGYAGLVVHGPLLAILLLDLLRREMPGTTPLGFWFRAMRPVFDTGPFRIAGRPDGARVHLWAEDNQGALAMRAEATLA